MAYISGGQLNQNRSPWRLSIISDMFWGFLNFLSLFFRTMYEPNLTKKELRSSGGGHTLGGGGNDDPPRPPRRMGGINHRKNTGPNAPPMAGGG